MTMNGRSISQLGRSGSFLSLVDNAEAWARLWAVAFGAPRSNSTRFRRTGRTPDLAKNPQVVTLHSSGRRRLAVGGRLLPRTTDLFCRRRGQQQHPVGQHHQSRPTFFARGVTESPTRPRKRILGELMHALQTKTFQV